MAQKPKIVLQGKDIAPYLYGWSARILSPTGKGLGEESLVQIREQIERQDPNSELFGVKLKPLKKAELTPGKKLLQISTGGGVLLKSILEIIRIEKVFQEGKEETVFRTKTLFPEVHKGAEGFCVGYDPFFNDQQVLFLVYSAKNNTNIKKVTTRKRKLSFYEKILGFASDLAVLIECWAICHAPHGAFDKYWSADPLQAFWKKEFSKRHPEKNFHHIEVWHQLEFTLMEGTLTGINRIYDNRYSLHFDAHKDLISPLLHQMQIDILEAMYQDPYLEKMILNVESEYLKNRLRVIFEMWYGPKDLQVAPNFSKNQQGVPPSNKARKLELLERLIKRGATEGEKEAAKAAWERISGQIWCS